MRGVLVAFEPAFVGAVCSRLVPPSARLSMQATRRFFAIVEDAIEKKGVGRKMTWFLRLVRWLPLLRYGRRFEELEDAQQDEFLRSLMDSRFSLIRKGLQGLRTLLLLGFYGRPEVGEEIGWTPSRLAGGRV